MVFRAAPFNQQPGGISKHAGIVEVRVKSGIYFDAEDSFFPVIAAEVNHFIKLADFLKAHIGGIKAVFAGVMVSRLTAPFTFEFHTLKIAQ